MNKKDAFEADNAKQYETFFDSTVVVDIIVQFSYGERKPSKENANIQYLIVSHRSGLQPTMSSSKLIEVFGYFVFSFTRGVTEHYNPEEPEYTAESFGYDPLQSTGREWYYLPVDELIYQEYSDREITSWDYLASRSLNVEVIDACSPEENEETQEDQQDEDKAMAWKRLRPSALRTVCKSMYIAALISLLTATIRFSIHVKLISMF